MRMYKLYRLKGITNYIHLLSSGHNNMSDYLHKWRNILTLPARVGIFEQPDEDILFPTDGLRRWLLWLCGHTYEEMLAFHGKNKAEKETAAAEAAASSATSNAPEEKMDESDDEDDDDIWVPGLDLNNGDDIDNMYGGNDL
eukprot:scaffold47783_cov53-Attheya_sp.AAC.7